MGLQAYFRWYGAVTEAFVGKEKEDTSEHYFLDDLCKNRFSELSMWTSVLDCLSAARYLEGRPEPEDRFDRQLIVPFIDNDTFEAVCLKCLAWLVPTFRVPESKIHMATLIDPKVKNSTVQILRNVRFNPTISRGAAGMIEHLHGKRLLLVQDEPHIIELVQNPIRCMLDLINRFWPMASNIREMIVKARERDGSTGPPVFHQPYTDGSLAALIDAVLFYVHGLDLGPRYSQTSQGGINRGFRSFEVVGHPPVDPRLFETAQEMTERMFGEIA